MSIPDAEDKYGVMCKRQVLVSVNRPAVKDPNRFRNGGLQNTAVRPFS